MWADAYDSSGATKIDSGYIAAGETQTVTIKPNAQVCGMVGSVDVTDPTGQIVGFSASFQASTGEPAAIIVDTISCA